MLPTFSVWVLSGQVLGAIIGLDVEDTMVKEDIMGTNRKEEKGKVG